MSSNVLVKDRRRSKLPGAPGIFCSFSSKEVLSGRFMIGQYLTIHGDVISHVNVSSVSVEDGGEYACTAENRAGQETHRARLNVYGNVTLRSLLLTNLPTYPPVQPSSLPHHQAQLLITNLPNYPPVHPTCLPLHPLQSTYH